MTTSASKLRIPLSIEDIFKRVFLGKPKMKYNLPVKQITTEGVSCASALKFLSGYLKTGKASEGYKCGIAKFKAPGLVPQRCTKPGKKVTFAGLGG